MENVQKNILDAKHMNEKYASDMLMITKWLDNINQRCQPEKHYLVNDIQNQLHEFQVCNYKFTNKKTIISDIYKPTVD